MPTIDLPTQREIARRASEFMRPFVDVPLWRGTIPTPLPDEGIRYPESDGKPMADNMTQARWMRLIFGNLDRLYKDAPNVLVCTDLLWYPVQGRANFQFAPDVMVVFGRPPYERGSYQQWKEDNIAPQVVFEILSDSNTFVEMLAKVRQYGALGVEECYVYEPDSGGLEVFLFPNGVLTPVPVENEWVSPRLGIRFVPQPRADMEIFFADGTPFLSHRELDDLVAFRTEERDRERERANAERQRAEAERERADAERQRAEAESERVVLAEAEIARLRALLAQSRDGV